MIKRRRLQKLPLQANYYPIPSAIYIEDTMTRLTIVTGQPLGGSSLETGEIEIMQDRRLSHDDERGLGQGVLDNQPVMHIFRLLLENIKDCTKPVENYAMGELTQTAHKASIELLNPVDKFIFAENDWLGVLADFGTQHAPADQDMEVVLLRRLNDMEKSNNIRTGIVLHRTALLQCPTNDYQTGMVCYLLLYETNIFYIPITNFIYSLISKIFCN